MAAPPAPLRARALLWGLPLVPLAAAVLLSGRAPRMVPLRDLRPEEVTAIGAELRAREPAMFRDSLERFPGDDWSQGDHFGNQERGFVRDHAATYGARPGAVLRAIAEDLRAHPAPPGAVPDRGTAPPCMPRPFYE